MSVKLTVKNLSLEYTNQQDNTRTLALSDINFDVQEGEFVSIVGPSGCGKTTFLNCVAGLIRTTGGAMLLDGEKISGTRPDIAMVFQSPCLLPWRTVYKNIIYGLELAKVPVKIANERVKHFTALVGLEGFEKFYPHQLSGGMQQRVNLARALVKDPKLIILDEPFANLDAQTREFMQMELLRVWEAAGKTALFVTHQINEAIFLSDRVIVFSARPGHIKEIINVDIPRPRQLSVKRSPRFLELEDQIWALIEKEVRKSGNFGTVSNP